MNIIRIEPMKSIGPIELGMSREEVYTILNTKGNRNKTVEWIGDYHIQFKDDRVIFIEIPDTLKYNSFVLYNNVDVFNTEVNLLVSYISKQGDYDQDDEELGYSYIFHELGIGFWRPSIFEYSMIEDEEFKSLDKSMQLDEIKYLYFQSASVFDKGYYDL